MRPGESGHHPQSQSQLLAIPFDFTNTCSYCENVKSLEAG